MDKQNNDRVLSTFVGGTLITKEQVKGILMLCWEGPHQRKYIKIGTLYVLCHFRTL